MSLLTKIFGSNDREVKKYLPRVDEINALEPAFEAWQAPSPAFTRAKASAIYFGD